MVVASLTELDDQFTIAPPGASLGPIFWQRKNAASALTFCARSPILDRQLKDRLDNNDAGGVDKVVCALCPVGELARAWGSVISASKVSQPSFSKLLRPSRLMSTARTSTPSRRILETTALPMPAPVTTPRRRRNGDPILETPLGRPAFQGPRARVSAVVSDRPP